jgi:SAM-dependent methyltransferase
MNPLVGLIDRNFYADFHDNWDDELFRKAVLDFAQPEWKVLDLGAGAGIVTQMNIRGQVRTVCGLDPDPRVVTNHALDEGHVGMGEHIPFEDESFDLVFSDNVLEHLSNPIDVFREVWRTLKPDGAFLFKTPNRLHYVPVIARLTPHSAHKFVNRLRGRAHGDTFPTHYRANSPAAIRRLAHEADFEVDELRLIEGRPEYLRMSALTYLAGLAYERLVNSTTSLSRFRVVMIGRLRKPRSGKVQQQHRAMRAA